MDGNKQIVVVKQKIFSYRFQKMFVDLQYFDLVDYNELVVGDVKFFLFRKQNKNILRYEYVLEIFQ